MEAARISKAYGFTVPSTHVETTNVQIAGEKSVPTGIKLTTHLSVTSVAVGSPCHTKILVGDVILSINGTKVETRQEYNEMISKIINSGSYGMDIAVVRPVVSLPIKPHLIPRGYDIIAGCKYHVGVIYKIPNSRLSLSIKAYSNKVFVTKADENTMAGLTLKLGDTILDVDGNPVSTVVDTSEFLFNALKKKGYVELIVEQPVEIVNKNIVRQALVAEKTTEPDLPVDVRQICKNELQRFKTNPNLNPLKQIMRNEKKGEKSKREPPHISVSEKSEDIPIACDGNPDLLMPVPTPNFQIQSQQGPAPASPAK